MNTIDTLYAATQKSYEHLYDTITELAKHPDDENCAMWEAIAHDDYDKALEAYVLAREKEAKEAWGGGELPFLEVYSASANKNSYDPFLKKMDRW